MQHVSKSNNKFLSPKGNGGNDISVQDVDQDVSNKTEEIGDDTSANHSQQTETASLNNIVQMKHPVQQKAN